MNIPTIIFYFSLPWLLNKIHVNYIYIDSAYSGLIYMMHYIVHCLMLHQYFP